ncbi:hypothetical protein ACQR5T_14470 [Xanthomonas oryzae pv. oryzicola]|uniref:hypothetical protein n=1 Tax=Xanthomonas oryzae TaxID=347 RepID=UPI0003FA0389|nr:hypothetical protein [Xanthomonas oryzae]AKO03924.1 membrane protein [Xanthomonas oryzae pv. oryzicola]AKO07807.1 membrane protein [Xanthomonas oryzae pv. oryzicola]AUJ13352.1 hypothetical protein BVV20_16040 [Xanthomonas oryzae pv. oryzae]OWB24103.1 hypothetical protein XocBAI15_14685 [Xanthomonas oryzae pv. oryzicola]OWB33184.1 hypothetical protein XocBAI20_01005 [Xanthomonas oryzae pv. oryzicola]
MFESLSTLLLDGLLLALPIIGIVRLRGVRLNSAMLAAILAAMLSAHCIQSIAGLPEQALPILRAALIGAFTLCAMAVSARTGRENTP